MDLFIQPTVELEKTASEVELPEDPNTWPKEVLDELFKQVPYIADFHPHVVMSKVDSERKYGLGHIEISNQSEAPNGSDPKALDAAGIRSVRVPVIIRDGKLSPFDLLVNDQSKVCPLTEERLRQAVFRPQAFDVTSQTPGDQSMVGQLYPPSRQNQGFGGGGGGAVLPASGMGKAGSALEQYLTPEAEKKAGAEDAPPPLATPKFQTKKASVLEAVLPTVNKSDLDNFWEKVSSDDGLRAQFRKNAQSSSFLLGLLANHEPLTAEKVASALPSYIKPSVVQVSRASNGYLVKAASHHYWKPFEQTLDRGELVERFGAKVAMAADTSGAVTLAADAEQETEPEEEQAPVITEPGVYKVKTEEGTEIVGFVIPNLVDTDGGTLPLALFTNGSQATVQSEIHGEEAGEGANLPTGPVMGMGAFFCSTPEGLIATVPMTLSGSYEGEEQPATYTGETFDGRPIEVSQQQVAEPIGMEEGKLLLPMHWQWSPMDKAGDVALMGSEEDFGGEEEEPEKEAMLHIRASGSAFSFSGDPVEKLAQEDKNFLDLDSAMFLMAGLGVDQGFGTTKLAHAMSASTVEKVKVGRQLTLARDANAAALASATEKLAGIPDLRRDLVKEASMISDPMAVDTVLSIGFLNPENIMTFVSYLPQVDDSQLKMCELLLAARLGLQNVSETALERAVRSTEEVIEGLKIIAFSQ